MNVLIQANLYNKDNLIATVAPKKMKLIEVARKNLGNLVHVINTKEKLREKIQLQLWRSYKTIDNPPRTHHHSMF